MPALFAGKETSPDGHARIIITSSSGAHLDVIHWGSFKDGPERKKMSTQALYYQSKHVSISQIGRCFHQLSAYVNMNTGERSRSATDCTAICGQGHHRHLM